MNVECSACLMTLTSRGTEPDTSCQYVNGAGGVRKVKLIDGRETLLQRFISVLVPANKMMMDGSSGGSGHAALCGAAHSPALGAR